MIVELREHTSVSVDLPDPLARRFAGIAGPALDIVPERAAGRWRISAHQFVGSVAVDGLQVLVRPKISPENLFLFLGAGLPASAWRSEAFDYGSTHDLLPAVLSFFARTVETTLGRGVLRGYRTEEQRLIALRGRVDTARHIQRGGLLMPVDCRFDEFTADNPENRYLKAAVRQALRAPRLPAEDRRRLRHALAALEDVAEGHPPDWERLHLTRLTAHYLPALRLARLVLDHLSLVDVRGDVAASAFLVDMNALFERFLTARLADALRGRLQVRAQTVRHLDESDTVALRPDLEFHRDGKALLVADIKYKLTADARARREDHYQLLAYTTALGLPAGLLVYCRQDSEAVHQVVRVRNQGADLHVHAIDAGGPTKKVDDEVRALADLVVRLCARSHH